MWWEAESKEESPDHKGSLKAHSELWTRPEVFESRCVPWSSPHLGLKLEHPTVGKTEAGKPVRWLLQG